MIKAQRRPGGWSFLLLLITVGAQTMIVELTIPRLLAPAFGNTLFCWTAIIAVVLVALTVGYQIGGALSAHTAVARSVVRLAAASATLVIGVAVAGPSVVAALSGLGMMAGPLVAAASLAALPAGLGAAVVPLVVETRAMSAGRASGECYAWSTVGSVVGVLATGYLLLPWLGLSGSMLLGASLVFVSVMTCARPFLGAAGLVFVAVAAYGASAVSVSSSQGSVLLDQSNGYHRIRIVEPKASEGIRVLFLDSTVEGAVRLGSPQPVLDYQQDILDIAEILPSLQRVLFLGGGSFTMPRAIKARFPDAEVEAVEIDHDVVRAARRYLELDERVNVVVDDGRHALDGREGRYELIVNDAFHGVRNIPFHLLTREFDRKIALKLSPEGIYAVNVIGYPRKSRLVQSVTRTLMQEFTHVRHFAPSARQLQNVWILASQHLSAGMGHVFTVDESLGRILTDDDAPVEYLIALDMTERN